jgi:outer membrane protein OmpA-like peptidoglycan-associated protein
VRIFVAVVAASVMALGAGTMVRAQDVESLARDLSAKPKPTEAACPKKLPDGSCPDTVDTRQMRIGGAATAAAPVKAVARAIRSDISMTFVKGSAELTASAKATLDRFAKALVGAGTYRPFTVEGHTDKSGTREINQALSQSRADSVVRYLEKDGVDKSRMTAKGFGFDRTLPGKSAEDPANRRVEVSAS